jgi:5'-3' exonuclease
VVNLQGNDLKTRIDCSPEEYLRRKIIIGDKSDNIPSIRKMIGEKTAAKLASSSEALQNLFTKYPESKVQFDLNTLLISFQQIPESLRKKVIENYIKTL